MAEREYRIKLWMAWALIISALLVDLAELAITYIGIVAVGGLLSLLISFTATAVFGIWFSILRVNESSKNIRGIGESGQKLLTMIIGVLGENIPAADAIPFWFLWTLGMMIIIGMTRMEDRGEKPSVLGGLSESFSFASPAAFIGNKARQLVKRKLHIGQIKQEDKIQNAAEVKEPGSALEAPSNRIETIRQKYQNRASPHLDRAAQNRRVV